MSAFKSEFLHTLSTRGFIHQTSDDAGLDALFTKETVSAYIGFDPDSFQPACGRFDSDHDAALDAEDGAQTCRADGWWHRYGWRPFV